MYKRQALAPFAEQITWAFIYGSIAKGEAHSSSDIDLMLIGQSLNYSEVMEQLMPLEEQLGRTINPTLYTPDDWTSKWNAGNSFVQRVVQQDKINLMGGNPQESMDGQQGKPGEPAT